MLEIALTNRLFVLGGGLVVTPQGSYEPSLRMMSRRDTAVAYYLANKVLFEEEGAYIAISGGRQYGLEGVPQGISEAGWLQDAFGSAGIPEHLHRSRVEHDATDTAENLLHALERGFFKPSDFTPEAPLGIVAGKKFGRRVQLYTHYLGFPTGSVAILETGEKEKPEEEYLYSQTQKTLRGMRILDTVSNIAELRRRHATLVALLHNDANRHHLEPLS